MIILAICFDLVPLFYFLKWNRLFSTFIPVFSEHVTSSNPYLSREMCTNLQVKKIFASEVLLHNLKVRGFTFQSKNIKKLPSQIYSFWNCLSRNLHLIELIMIILLQLLPKYLRKTLKTDYRYSLMWPPGPGKSQSTIMITRK